MVRSSATAVTLPWTFSPLLRDQSLMRRASRAATIAISYLLVPGCGIRDASFVMVRSSWVGVEESARGLEAAHPRALGIDDRDEPGDRRLELVVHHEIIVFLVLRQLLGSILEPSLDRL